MERKALESAAANCSYLRGLLSIPVGIVLIVAALGNWKWGPLRHAWVFVACVLAAGLAGLAIIRYYSERYGHSLHQATGEGFRGGEHRRGVDGRGGVPGS
jgi:hypothetical protein